MAMTSQRPQASGGPKPKPEQRVVSYIASSQAPGSDDETSVARLAGIGKRNEQREALPARSRTSPQITHLTHLTTLDPRPPLARASGLLRAPTLRPATPALVLRAPTRGRVVDRAKRKVRDVG
jgi:hypothetical protein